MNADTKAMYELGERRIAERRAEVARAKEEVRQTISDLIDERERLVRENRALRAVMQQQARLLDHSEPARVVYAQAEGATQ